MNKKLLIKDISGKTTPEEKKMVAEWIDANVLNKQYYIDLMNVVAMGDFCTNANKGSISEDEKRRAFDTVRAKIGGEEGRKSKSIMPQILKYAAILVVVVSSGLNLYQYLSNKKVKESVVTAENIFNEAEVTYTCYTDKGVKGKIVLPDSSVVWLNSDSKIIYPHHFSSDARKLVFSGEGYFDVSKHPDWPMDIVTPKGMKVEVLGTKFHLRSYDDDDHEQATLFTGKINVTKTIHKDGTADEYRIVELKPNESVIFSDAIKSDIVSTADTVKSVAWRRGELIFDKTPMSEVFKMLERWHGMDIVVKDSTILNHTFTAAFSSESMVQIMELIKFTTYVDYKIVGNKVIVTKREVI